MSYFSKGFGSSLPRLLMSLLVVNRNGLNVDTDAEVLISQVLESVTHTRDNEQFYREKHQL
jgi:hypothetical protein